MLKITKFPHTAPRPLLTISWSGRVNKGSNSPEFHDPCSGNLCVRKVSWQRAGSWNTASYNVRRYSLKVWMCRCAWTHGGRWSWTTEIPTWKKSERPLCSPDSGSALCQGCGTMTSNEIDERWRCDREFNQKYFNGSHSSSRTTWF